MTDLAALWAALPQISNIHASADGTWAFWCWAGVTGTEDLWCAPTDGSAAPERLTFGVDHFGIRDVSPDGMRLILNQSRNSCEHDSLWLFDRAMEAGGLLPPAPPEDIFKQKKLAEKGPGKLVRLTPDQDSHYVYGGRLTADGAAVIFVADFDFGTDAVTQGGVVWRQDIATGARTCLCRTPTFFDRAPSLSPDGLQVLLNRNDRRPGSTQLWVMGVDGANLREVLCLGETNNTRGDWISDDRIAFVTDHEGRDRLGVLTLSTGMVDWLAGEPEVFPHEVVAGFGGRFACIVHQASWSRALVWDGAALRPLPNLSGRRSLLPHAALPDGGWLAEAYDASAPHDLVRVFPDGRCLTLARAAPEAGRIHPAPPQDFRWAGPDGRAMQGWLYRPEGPAKGLIAYIHGGPTWHSEDWLNPKIGFWVQAGYAVLDPNYRGSTGFGFAHREAVKDDGWGGREQGDIRAGIEAALASGIPGPVAVAGNSYGGFSSWVAITRHADLVTAAIPMCGMYRLDIDYHETEMPHGRAYSEEMMGGAPEEFPEKYANASPGNFIHQIRGHVMVVHGLADSNVGPENTHTAVRELAAAGIPHEVLLYPDEGHGVFRRANVADYLARSATFLDRAFAKGMR
jgi:dipeptidyl aminopeptidase/acylaminoacyl peptidase